MKDIRLYDYQEEMRRRIEASFETHQSVMVQMPAGTGKTVLLASIVKYEGRRVGQPCVWIVAHRRELVEQIEATLARMLEEEVKQVWLETNRTDLFQASLSFVKVMSIQWLSRHYQELYGQPTLIVIDEAHHAVAKTYSEVMNAYPEARKLGVTATPCRLTKRGFTDLFEVLLCSHSILKFIKDGYLSDYDYISLNPSSEDQKKIEGLVKRAADGDYNIAEMQSVLDCCPSIGRLYQSVEEFVSGKKGIAYAINIEHAEHIAEYYREQGVKAVAISSRTPKEERRRLIERFRDTNSRETAADDDGIQVLVNVDLFGEGFDCPDVEFIQLARPTLSLAKYLQMVGRGMRVAKNKECCTILDNVGLYRLFGLPAAERNWDAMFLGKQAGKGESEKERDMTMLVMSATCVRARKEMTTTDDRHTEMVVIARHDEPDVLQRLREMQHIFRTVSHLMQTKYGFMGGCFYFRTEEPQGVFRKSNEVRLGWRLISKAETGGKRYFLLNECSEQIEYVGRKCPWTECADGVTECYCLADGNADDELCPIHVKAANYITGNEQATLEKGLLRKGRWGDEQIITYIYYNISKDDKCYCSKDAYVCKHFIDDEYAICNNCHYIILRGLKRVILSEDNMAEVIFMGEDETKWINLYTMQEFRKRPIVERHGFVELLKVEDRYYFYKYRQLAGIPIKGGDYAESDRAFRFMRQYVILKEYPDSIYEIVDEYMKGNQRVAKLKNSGYMGLSDVVEIPSEYLPIKFK